MDKKYHQYYCEENIYLLCEEHNTEKTLPGTVIFITNRNRTCCFNYQKKAAPGMLMTWDYHVVFLYKRMIYDYDTRLPFPCPADEYFLQTFPGNILPEYMPLFIAVSSADFINKFSSDRRHMKKPDGSWIKPPPPWPVIAGKNALSVHELPAFLNCAGNCYGQILDLSGIAGLIEKRKSIRLYI